MVLTASSLKRNETTTPKFPPPPRKAQNKSAFLLSDAFTTHPSANTTSASKRLSKAQAPRLARQVIERKFSAFGGRKVQWGADDSLVAVFNDPLKAVQCAKDIQNALPGTAANGSQIVLKLGLSAGQPVNKKGDFFKDVISCAHRLSIIAPDGHILVCSFLRQLCKKDFFCEGISSIKLLTRTEEEFLFKVFDIVEKNLSNCLFSLDTLCNLVCVSRPQLYRKITSLTGQSPNNFIRALRMQKAMFLLKQKSWGISEIAYQVGFNTPSYFAKCFLDKYGCTPSDFVRTS